MGLKDLKNRGMVSHHGVYHHGKQTNNKQTQLVFVCMCVLCV